VVFDGKRLLQYDTSIVAAATAAPPPDRKLCNFSHPLHETWRACARVFLYKYIYIYIYMKNLSRQT